MRPFRGRRMLLAEGDALTAGTITAMLHGLGATVVGPAINTEIALDMARTEDFDLAILDLVLDGRRGFDVAEAVQHR